MTRRGVPPPASKPPMTSMPPTALETTEDYQAAADFLAGQMRRIVAVSPWMNPRVTRGVFLQPEAGLPEGYVPPSAALAPPPGWCEVTPMGTANREFVPLHVQERAEPVGYARMMHTHGNLLTEPQLTADGNFAVYVASLPRDRRRLVTVTIGPAWVGRVIARWVLTVLRCLEVL